MFRPGLLLFCAIVMPLLLLAGCAKEKPDIAAGILTVLPINPVPTVPATVSLPVRNNGGKGSGPFSWTVTRDGQRGFASGRLEGLAPGASTTLSFGVLESTTSVHSYLVILNSDNDFAESNLENNTALASIGFAPTTVNVAVTSLVSVQPSPTGINPVTLTATIVSPLISISAATNLEWTLSSANFTTLTGTITNLAPGQTVTQAVPVGVLTPATAYDFTFSIGNGATNTDPDVSDNSATTGALSAIPRGVAMTNTVGEPLARR